MQMRRPVRLQHIDEVLQIRRPRHPRNRRQPRIEQRIARWIDQVRRLRQHQFPQICVVRIRASHGSPPAVHSTRQTPHVAAALRSASAVPRLPFASTRSANRPKRQRRARNARLDHSSRHTPHRGGRLILRQHHPAPFMHRASSLQSIRRPFPSSPTPAFPRHTSAPPR